MKRKLKILAGFIILGGTVLAFIHYASTHPALLDKLRQTNPLILIMLVTAYVVWFLALVIILRISIRMYGITISKQENVLLNAYSSLANFFGPGQSGPAVRGLYLKKRHGLGIKKYLFASLIYYGFYAFFSAFLLLIGSQAWWVTTVALVAVGATSFIVLRWYARRAAQNVESGVSARAIGWIAAATAFQVLAQAAIFLIELRQIDPTISLAQAFSYTGAANFAVFVSLTPGAIGIREAFLVFSQNIHGISNTVMVAANVIDRAVYLLFLGVLFGLVVGLHAKEKLRITQYLGQAGERR